ncbi:MAG: GOLPH3/VPS74 family protein, partial [Natronosporangium sp.]
AKLAPKVFALGLAGALLGELILGERITIEGDRLRVVDRHPPADALSHTILDHLLAEGASAHPVRTWLVFLARQSVEQVAERLWRTGHIRRERSRRLFSTETLYPPTDTNVAYWPTARISTALNRGRQLTWPDAALAGLTVATGLDAHLLYTGDAAARGYLRHIIDHLTPSLHALVWHLDAAVGDAVLTGRT